MLLLENPRVSRIVAVVILPQVLQEIHNKLFKPMILIKSWRQTTGITRIIVETRIIRIRTAIGNKMKVIYLFMENKWCFIINIRKCSCRLTRRNRRDKMAAFSALLRESLTRSQCSGYSRMIIQEELAIRFLIQMW